MHLTHHSIIYLILFGIIMYFYYDNYFKEQLSDKFILGQTKLDSIYSHFPKRYITTAGFGGRFGNKMFRFASLYGLGRDIGRDVYFDGRNNEIIEFLQETEDVFPIMHDKFHIKYPMENMVYIAKDFAITDIKYDSSIKNLENISNTYLNVGASYLQSYKYFHHYRDEIKQIFQCGPSIMNKVNDYARKLFKTNDESKLLCIHIRRTDFTGSFFQETTKEFLLPALNFSINYLKENGNDNISTLFVGDDLDFAKKLKLKHLHILHNYLPEGQNRAEDLCLVINYCHSILLSSSGSSFAFWLAYLLPDDSIVFYNNEPIKDKTTVFRKDLNPDDFFLKEWISIKVEDGKAVRVVKPWQKV